MTNRLDEFSFGNPPGALCYIAGNRDGSTADLARQPVKLMLRKIRGQLGKSIHKDQFLFAKRRDPDSYS